MALCPDPTGTAIVGGDGVFISGSGTAGDPWVINLVDPGTIADLEEDIASLQAALLTLPGTYVNVVGDTMTGVLVTRTAGPGLRMIQTTADTPYLDFWTDAAVAERLGYIQSSPVGLTIRQEAGHLRIYPETVTLFYKGTQGEENTGVEVHNSGSVVVTRSAAGANIQLNKTSVADVNGGQHVAFQSAGTTIGSITRATSTTIAFNTTSDEDLKENMVPVDDELSMQWMRTIQPQFFNYRDRPDIRHVGYSAQQVAAQWPNALSNGIIAPGHGNIEDRTWDADGNETTPESVWRPWMMDHAKLTPILHACLQTLDRCDQVHLGRIAELEAIVAAQADRLTALEAALGGESLDEAVAELREEVFYTRTMSAGWQFSNTTTAPPGAGQLRTNVALTEMYLHKTDSDGYSRAASMNFIVARTALDPDCVRFRVRGTSGSVLELRTSAPVVDNGTYLTIPISILSGTATDKGFRVEVTLLSEIWSEDPPI